jgi:7,8-dihydropterin-6-yl-methyl-4-(beta-D-ribofuranosyl)aminobenzene 5'-phosphate synthase
MKMLITTLVENTVNKHGLIGEHGLSFLIETDDEAILFDTGQGYAIIHNAQKMDIDLSKIKKIVLSHGHYDHTGGLKSILTLMDEVQIYGHPNIFVRKYAKDEEKLRYIGLPYTKEELESEGVALHLSREPIQITERIKTTGEIKLKTSFETISDRLCVMRDGNLVKDTLLDDLSLVVSGKDGIAIIFGCGHSGIINILNHVRIMTNNAPISYIIGGIHLIDATTSKIHKTIELLKEFNIRRLALCHCTGMLALLELIRYFGDKLIINSTGNSIEL